METTTAIIIGVVLILLFIGIGVFMPQTKPKLSQEKSTDETHADPINEKEDPLLKVLHSIDSKLRFFVIITVLSFISVLFYNLFL